MRKSWFLLGIVTIVGLSLAADKLLTSSVYEWEKLNVIKTSYGEERNFLNNPTRSLEVFNIKAITLYPGKSTDRYQVKQGFDELIIMKEGSASVQVNDERIFLLEGSVIVVSSGDNIAINNSHNANTSFYSINFKPAGHGSHNQQVKRIPLVFIDWDKVEFVSNENGGRRNIMQQKTSNLKELEIHVTTIKEGLSSHAGHTHPDEELILVREGVVEMKINDKSFKAGPGSLFFLGNDDFHGLTNAGKGQCEYYAIRWLTE
jgi:uncharacterized cupin superfamily protein